MSFRSPVGWDTLVDWWAGELDQARAQEVEAHVLGCGPCAAEAERVAATAETLRTMIPPVVDPGRLRRLAAAGVRIVENPLAPGSDSSFRFPEQADVAVHVLGGLRLPPGVDVEVTLRSGSSGDVLGRVRQAPADRARGAVYVACQRDYAQLDPHLVVEVRAGQEPPVRYTVRHVWPAMSQIIDTER